MTAMLDLDPIDVTSRRANVAMVSDELMIRRAMPIDVDGAVMVDPQRRRGLIDASFAAGKGWVAQRNRDTVAFALVTDHFYGRPFIDLLVGIHLAAANDATNGRQSSLYALRRRARDLA